MSFKAVLIFMFYILLVFFLQNIYGRNKLFPDNFPYFRLSNILNNLNSNSKFRDFILFILTIVNVSRLVKQYKRKCQNIVFGICLCFHRWGEAARPMSTFLFTYLVWSYVRDLVVWSESRLRVLWLSLEISFVPHDSFRSFLPYSGKY